MTFRKAGIFCLPKRTCFFISFHLLNTLSKFECINEVLHAMLELLFGHGSSFWQGFRTFDQEPEETISESIRLLRLIQIAAQFILGDVPNNRDVCPSSPGWRVFR